MTDHKNGGHRVTEVLIGAASWEEDEWLASFYPEDLPAEWRMAYYANEFSTTVINCHTYCDAAGMDLLTEMLEDCHEGFRPVLSINPDKVTLDQAGLFFQWLDELDSEIGIRRLAGVLLSLDVLTDGESLLQDWRQRIPRVLPVALDGDIQFDTENQRRLSEQHISPVWRADRPAIGGQGYWLAVVSLTGDTPGLATQMGYFLDSITAENSACVIAASGYGDISRLHELSTIVRLIHG